MRSLIIASFAVFTALSSVPAQAHNNGMLEQPPIYVDNISSSEAKVALSEGRVVCAEIKIGEAICYLQKQEKGKEVTVTITFLVKKNPGTTFAEVLSRALIQMLPSVSSVPHL